MSDFKDVAHKTVAELFDMLKEKVAEVDSLKTQLNNMETCYIEKKKQVDEALTEIGHYWKTGATDCIESAEEALRGGS